MDIRYKEKLGPLLVVYPIHKDSRGKTKNKQDLGAVHHILGAALMYTSEKETENIAGTIVQIQHRNEEV
jgi:hypothetical protein